VFFVGRVRVEIAYDENRRLRSRSTFTRSERRAWTVGRNGSTGVFVRSAEAHIFMRRTNGKVFRTRNQITSVDEREALWKQCGAGTTVRRGTIFLSGRCRPSSGYGPSFRHKRIYGRLSIIRSWRRLMKNVELPSVMKNVNIKYVCVCVLYVCCYVRARVCMYVPTIIIR